MLLGTKVDQLELARSAAVPVVARCPGIGETHGSIPVKKVALFLAVENGSQFEGEAFC